MNTLKSLTIGAAVLALCTIIVRADVTGKVTLKGTPTNPDKPIVTKADPKCKHDKPDFKTENWKVGVAGELADVVVWVEKPGGGGTPAATKPVIDQVGCQYVPHVIAVSKGSTVILQNTDSTLHTIHATAWRGKGQAPTEMFNFAQIHFTGPPKQDEKQLKDAGIVKLECNVHPWMNAWIVVTDTPWFAVSAVDGTVKIPGVADGEYTVKAWHSQFKTPLEQKVKVTGGSATVNFEFDTAQTGK